jgi:hypothetical protein
VLVRFTSSSSNATSCPLEKPDNELGEIMTRRLLTMILIYINILAMLCIGQSTYAAVLLLLHQDFLSLRNM